MFFVLPFRICKGSAFAVCQPDEVFIGCDNHKIHPCIPTGSCKHDAALLHQMQDFLEQYRALRGVQLELFPYTKPMELLADIEAGVRFDVLFLDVLMPGINGINAAREIRQYDTAVQSSL